MKPSETRKIYETQCRARRITPQQDEFEMWHKHLKEFDARDIEAAVDAWNSSTATDNAGELRAKWLPKPAELAPLVRAVIDRRRRERETPKDFVVWGCPKPGGCGFTCSGFVDTLHTKNCPRCGKPMFERLREKARMKGAA